MGSFDVPLDDERTQLDAFVEEYRSALEVTLDCLTEEQARRRLVVELGVGFGDPSGFHRDHVRAHRAGAGRGDQPGHHVTVAEVAVQQ